MMEDDGELIDIMGNRTLVRHNDLFLLDGQFPWEDENVLDLITEGR